MAHPSGTDKRGLAAPTATGPSVSEWSVSDWPAFDVPAVDVLVIGGGVVGCAIARRLTLDGASVVLAEKGPDILCGASKANSAILHTGFDAPPGSLELACMRAGRAEYLAIADRFGLPRLETDALVVAWTAEELVRLDAIVAQAHDNGVTAVRRIGRGDLPALAPGLSAAALGAVRVPGEDVIDPWSAPLAYLSQAVANGARALFGAEVTGGRREDGVWHVQTTRGLLRAATLVNAAGLFGDRVAQALRGASDFTIRPRRGEFVVLDKAAAHHVPTILLPVPGERTKGIVVAPTIFGNVLVGPTAEEQDDRVNAPVAAQVQQTLLAHAARVVPGLAGMPVTAAYAGLRPATERKEYRVSSDPAQGWISVGGIRSTGLTAALGLAVHVAALYREMGHRPTAIADPVWPYLPNLAEHRPRDWQKPGNGGIVCQCELVTRREIEAALAGPLPPGDFGGLRRRTRAAMGRCQGFHCLATLAALTQGRLSPDIACDA